MNRKTEILAEIYAGFDFCYNVKKLEMVCYARKGNDWFACNDNNVLYSNIQKILLEDNMHYRYQEQKCELYPLIIGFSCQQGYGSYQHIDPIAGNKQLLFNNDINPITKQPESISSSLYIQFADDGDCNIPFFSLEILDSGSSEAAN